MPHRYRPRRGKNNKPYGDGNQLADGRLIRAGDPRHRDYKEPEPIDPGFGLLEKIKEDQEREETRKREEAERAFRERHEDAKGRVGLCNGCGVQASVSASSNGYCEQCNADLAKVRTLARSKTLKCIRCGADRQTYRRNGAKVSCNACGKETPLSDYL